VASAPFVRWRFKQASAQLERSTDGGTKWDTIDLSSTPIAITAGAAPSGSECWLVGRGGVVLHSTDTVTFTRARFPVTIDLVAITVGPSAIVVTAAGGRQFATTDRGVTWTGK
jgi:photosystem II stability/assembly factor-like uncharacterized protein